MTTITVAAATYPCPTDFNVYPDPELSVFVPIDGANIVHRSNNRGNQGDKNGLRTFRWGLLPATAPSGFTGTPATLKSLEGTATTINCGSVMGGVYNSSTNIQVHEVIVTRAASVGTMPVYAVSFVFSEV